MSEQRQTESTANATSGQRVGISEAGLPLVALIEPTLASINLELAHLELEGGNTQILRVYIDSPTGVTIDDCARASRHMSAMLDVEDPFETAYALEVSSPGVDRPLGRLGDWQDAIGETVQIKTGRSIDGRRRWTGTLTALDDNNAIVEVDNQPHRVPLGLIQKANLQYSFDKPRREESS